LTPDRYAINAVLGLSRIASAAFWLLVAVALQGQVASPPSSNFDAPIKLDAYFVTGSHIPLTETTAEALTFPMISINRSQIEQRGLSSTAELLQQISLANAGGVPVSNATGGWTPGASAVSLRGLGPDATLVLVNGRRLASYPIGADGTTSFVDLNTIPLQAIERIDLLKDGASAIYGSDALAGVINIVFKRGLTESVVTSGYGNTTRNDSSRFDAAVFLGRASTTGSLNLGVFYSHRNAIFQHDRGYSAVTQALSTNSSPGNFQVTRAAVAEALGQPVVASIPGVPDTAQLFSASTGPVDPATGAPLAGNRNAINDGHLAASAYTFSRGRSSRFNYNEFAGSFPEIDRRGLFLTWDRRLNQRVALYGDAFFSRSGQLDELAPYATGDFAATGQTTIVIPARTASPILTPVETAAGSRTAAPGAFNPFNPFNQDLAGGSRIRLAEFGNRTVDTRTEAVAATVGARIEGIGDRFALDTSGRYSRMSQSAATRLISASRFLRILNAADPLFNPSSPDYLGSAVPYNPFGYFRNEIATNSIPVDYATYYTHDKNRSDNLDLGAVFSTPSLFQLPGGDVGFALGTEYLRDSIRQASDPAGQAGEVLGVAPSPVTRSQRQVGAAFIEAELPLVSGSQHRRLLHALSVNIAARYEQFFTSHDHSLVPKVGLRWVPLADGSVVVRTSWGRAFLQPSLFELFSSPIYGQDTAFDPVVGDFAEEISVSSRGNSRLHAETSTSFNAGLVWTPPAHLVKGITCSVDFWRIERNGTPTLSLDETIKRATTGTLLAGESVLRNADGELTQVNATYFNAGAKVARGVDLSLSYTRPTARAGRFEMSLMGTYLASLRSAAIPGAPSEELVDHEVPGSGGNDAYLRWKALAHLGWSRKSVTLSLNTNYTAGFADLDGDGNPRRVASLTTLDVQCSWQLTPAKSATGHDILSGLKLTLGATNLLDHAPPFVSSGGGSSNNYPGTIYNSTGRFIYVNLEKRL